MIDAYRDSGLSHLLAVSGENVAFVMALAAPLLRRLRLGARTGRRARDRDRVRGDDAVRAVGAARVGDGGDRAPRDAGRPARVQRRACSRTRSIALFLADPFLVHSVAFALSCGASAGIALLSRPIGARLPGPRFVREPLAVSIGAQLGVLPVLLWVFGTFPLITPVANLVAAPAAELLGVYGFFASAVAGVAPRLGPLRAATDRACWSRGSPRWPRAGAAVPFRDRRPGRARSARRSLAAGASVACLRARRRRRSRPSGWVSAVSTCAAGSW